MSVATASSRSRFPVTTVVVGAWVVAVSAFVILGSDLMWVVALGDVMRQEWSVPHSVPFAAAPQSEWHNPIALAELVLSRVHAMGPIGLAAFQLAIVAACLAIIVDDGRRLGASEPRLALVVTLATIGCAAPFVVSRLPSMSLVPFVLAVAVMRRAHGRSDRLVWWLVPLYLVWGNLHGGVLVGLAVLGVFLVASPGAGPISRRAGVGVGAALSLLITSSGADTPAYYLNALTNEAAARGSDLWSRVDPGNPLDVAMVASAVLLLVLTARGRPPLWEWLTIVGLAVGTAQASRHGVFLVLFLAAAAARPRAHDPEAATGPSAFAPRLAVSAVTLVAVSVILVVRGPAVGPPGADLVDRVDRVLADAPGGVVLADEPLAETLGQRGVTVWASNPIDAFPREVQADFLDFLDEGSIPDGANVDLVVVRTSKADAVQAAGWSVVDTAGDHVLLLPPL